MWGCPIDFKYKDEDMCLLILDTEGLGHIDATSESDNAIATLSILLSSCFIYNTLGTIKESDVELLDFILNISSSIAQQTKKDDKNNPNYKFCDFFLMLRDSHLTPVKGPQKIPCTLREYLFSEVLKVNEDEIETDKKHLEFNLKKKKIRNTLIEYFDNIDAHSLPRPTSSDTVMKNIGNPQYENELESGFVLKMKLCINNIKNSLKPKKNLMGEGGRMDGLQLALFAELVLNHINSKNGMPLNIKSSWDSLVCNVYQNSIEKCISSYKKLIVEKIPPSLLPLPENEILTRHNQLMKNTIYPLF